MRVRGHRSTWSGAFGLNSDKRLVIGLLHVGGSVDFSIEIVGAANRNASSSIRWVFGVNHNLLGLLGRMDLWHQKTHRA